MGACPQHASPTRSHQLDRVVGSIPTSGSDPSDAIHPAAPRLLKAGRFLFQREARSEKRETSGASTSRLSPLASRRRCASHDAPARQTAQQPPPVTTRSHWTVAPEIGPASPRRVGRSRPLPPCTNGLEVHFHAEPQHPPTAGEPVDVEGVIVVDVGRPALFCQGVHAVTIAEPLLTLAVEVAGRR
jgi:hypothetical protein